MKNNGLFSSLFITELKNSAMPGDPVMGRTVKRLARSSRDKESFLKRTLNCLEFVLPDSPAAPGPYPLYVDSEFTDCISVLYLTQPGSDIDGTEVGSFYPAKLIALLRKRNINWGILTDGYNWRLYSAKGSRPYEDYVEFSLRQAPEEWNKAEYRLFKRFFHKNSFMVRETEDPKIRRLRDEAGRLTPEWGLHCGVDDRLPGRRDTRRPGPIEGGDRRLCSSLLRFEPG